MKKYFVLLKNLSAFFAFVSLFFYFYKKSGRFRKSLASASLASIIFVSGFAGLPRNSRATNAEGFTPKLPEQSRPHKNSGAFGSRSGDAGGGQGPGKPNGNDDGSSFPTEWPQTESVEKTKSRISEIQHKIDRFKEITESESESEDLEEDLEDVDFESTFQCKADTPDKTQAKLLYLDEDDEVIMDKVYQEAMRRAQKIDPNSNYTFERIQQLVTENVQTKKQRRHGAKETITAIQAETEGILKRGSSRRINLGTNKKGPIQGLDMGVEGVGKWSHITHIDIKNPVGTKIRARQKTKANRVHNQQQQLTQRVLKNFQRSY